MNGLNWNILLLFVCCCNFSFTVIAQSAIDDTTLPEWQKKYNAHETEQLFKEPPLFYAPHTFWFWDDVIVDGQKSASMAEEMIKQRLNPGYVHPRSGFDNTVTSLPVEQYLAEPWFDSFGNAMQKAKENGLTLGYCDDYNWPSGQAAGRVLQMHPELEATYLVPKRYYANEGTIVRYDSVDFVVAGKMVNNRLDASSLRVVGNGRNVQWSVPAGTWMIYTYTIQKHPGIDGGRVNYLDPKLMEVFIPLVHEQYEIHFRKEMGRTISGVFVDNEGDYGWKMAWSDYLATQYEKKKKRDIRTWLPLLTEKDKDGLYVVARCDWFEVVSDVYNECYFEPLVKWLKERNMYYISNLWEESLEFQTIAVGDLMKTTRRVTMPGNDCLEMKSQDVHDFKEIQSVAEFEDRPFMSEIMGVAGWIQSPNMMKMTINSITSFGVTHVVPHGIYMNRQLETIPFPADWFTENPYWNYLHLWTDFSRRAAFVTRQSSLVADVLLVNPVETVWSFSENYFSEEKGVQNAPWDSRVVEANETYSEAMRQMNLENVDFLVADKYYLSKGRVKILKGNDPVLQIQNHTFRAIVLPATQILSHASLKKIVDFAKQGGLVVLLGDVPCGSSERGMNDKRQLDLAQKLNTYPNVVRLATKKNRMKVMTSVLQEKMIPQIRLKNAGRLYTAQRKLGDMALYWFANNTDTLKHFTAWLRDAKGAAEIWNCETGEKKQILSSVENDGQSVSLTLNPYEGYWLAFHPNKMIISSESTDILEKEQRLTPLWKISYLDGDMITKTTAKVFYSEQLLENEWYLPEFDDSSWKYFSHQEEKKNECPYSYWRMNVPIGAVSVTIPANLIGKKVWIDEKNVEADTQTLFLDADTRYLSFFWNREESPMELVPFQFKVQAKENVTLDSWYAYGLQQYTGFLEYETVIQVDNPASVVAIDLGKVSYMAEVFVNGQSVGSRLWPPFRFDLSKMLKTGKNVIRVKVGNLIASEMWLKEDLGKVRLWGWKGVPDPNQYEAGFWGPIKWITIK